MSSTVFQSTRPIRGATLKTVLGDAYTPISIHAPHTGRDEKFYERRGWNKYFNPRAPYGARPEVKADGISYFDISIHAPHTGRDHDRTGEQAKAAISIHAPHTGRDRQTRSHCRR